MAALATLALHLLVGSAIGYGIAVYRDPRCLFETIRISLKTRMPVLGHSFVERERLNHCIVETMQCEWCGKWDLIWNRTELSVPEPHPDDIAPESACRAGDQ